VQFHWCLTTDISPRYDKLTNDEAVYNTRYDKLTIDKAVYNTSVQLVHLELLIKILSGKLIYFM